MLTSSAEPLFRGIVRSVAISENGSAKASSEVYSCILEQSSRPAERRNLLERLKHNGVPPDDRVELEEYFDILDHAVDRRNGWKAILERCSTIGRHR